jgi:hypothetical protein
MLDIEPMINNVIKIKNVDGDSFTARLVGIVDKGRYAELRCKSGITAYMAIEDITFICPIFHQPPPSEVV